MQATGVRYHPAGSFNISVWLSLANSEPASQNSSRETSSCCAKKFWVWSQKKPHLAESFR
jgi:hypothetical protein